MTRLSPSIFWIVTLFTLHYLLPNGFHLDYRLFQIRSGSISSHFSSEARNSCQIISERQKASTTITYDGTPMVKLVEAFTSNHCSIIVPINRKQTLPNQVCFPQSPLIVNHLTADSNNNENNNIEKVSFCWCKLLINGEIVGSPTKLKFDNAQVDMDDIKELMKTKFMDDLGGISAARLEIYAANDYKAKTPLKVDVVWDSRIHGGDTVTNSLVIRVPKPPSVWISLFDANNVKVATKEVQIKVGSNIDAIKNAVKLVFPKFQDKDDGFDLELYDVNNTRLSEDIVWDSEIHGGNTASRSLAVKLYNPALTRIDGLSFVPPEQVPVPLLIEKSPPPPFTAAEGWLDSVCDEIFQRLHEQDDPLERVPPLCLSRCSRGGKTRSLYEISKVLKERSPETAVIYVTFNDFSSIQPWEQNDPIGALFRRIAFAALEDRNYHDSGTQYKSLQRAGVDRAWIEDWLGSKPCVLLIDELNLVKNLGPTELNSESLSNILKECFLKTKGRYFVFSTHIVSTSDQLVEFMLTDSYRQVLKRALPLLSSVASGRANLSSTLTRRKSFFNGDIPGLIYTDMKGMAPTEKSKQRLDAWIKHTLIDNRTVLKLLATLINGESDYGFLRELMELMDVTDEGKIRWIPFHMVKVLDLIKNLSPSQGSLITEELRCHLDTINSLFLAFRNTKQASGEAWESLFVLILLVRTLTYQSQTLLGTNKIALKTQVTYNEPHNCISVNKMEEFLSGIPEKLASGPQLSVYYPINANFPIYDCFLVAWDTGGNRSKIIGYQLRNGRNIPKKDSSLNQVTSYVIRGVASRKTGRVRGWVTPSSDELDEFFGVTGKQWTPNRWNALESG